MIRRISPGGRIDEGRLLLYTEGTDTERLELWRSRHDGTVLVRFSEPNAGRIIITNEDDDDGATPTPAPCDDYIAARNAARRMLDDEAALAASALTPAQRLAMYGVLFHKYGIRITTRDYQFAELLRAAYPNPRKRK